MKWSRLLVLAGGLLATVAFYQPFLLVSTAAGVFGPGWSLQNLLRNVGLDFGLLCEPCAAFLLLLFGFGWRTPTLGREAAVGSAGAAVVGLAFLLVYFTSGYALGHAAGMSVEDEVQFLGSGYWLAALGCGLGLIGGLVEWRDRPTLAAPVPPAREPAARHRLRLRPAPLLVVAGGLALVAGFFLPPFFTLPPESGSLFERLRRPNGWLLIWPEPLAALLVLAGGVLTLSGRPGAYLGSLCGALISLPFLVEIVPAPFAAPIPFYDELGTGYWLAALGCMLGLVGALLGLRARLAAPVAASLTALPQHEHPAG